MSSKSYESLNQLRLQKKGCDVIIEIGAHEFHAHRVVLRRRMKYFRDLLPESKSIFIWFSKNKKSTIKLDPETIDPTYFSDILNYVYTFEIEFTNENIRAIYRMADYFRFYKLIDEVKEHISRSLTIRNFGHLQTIAREFGLESLEDVFTRFIDFVNQSLLQNIHESTRSILILSFKLLTKFVEKLREAERYEEMLHYSVDWIVHDEANRSEKLLELLKNIPLESLGFELLKQVAFYYKPIRNDIECLKLLFDSFIKASKPDVRKERKQRTDSLYAIGGLDRDLLSSVSRYHHSTRKWIPVTEMNYKRCRFGCAVIGQRIYVCGGVDGQRNLDELTVFDTYIQKWTELRPMKHARQLCAAAVLNGKIYVAGGRNSDDLLAVVERYCVETDRWEDVAPLTSVRSGHELVGLNGYLYAIGGCDRNSGLKSVERYDPQIDQWTRMNDTYEQYHTFGSAVLKGNIYIVGFDTCEVYSPADDKWSEMPAPSKSNFGRRLATYNGKLYAIGGEVRKSENFEGIATMEVFDIQARVWRPATDMNVARCFHGVAVVEKSLFVPIKMFKESLNEHRLQNTGYDVILEIGGREFPAHREVLMARMEFFRDIPLYAVVAHTEQENVSVIFLNPEIIDSTFFDEILNYIYTCKITFTTENIRPIYRTAKCFCFDELIYEMEEHMELTVNIDNVRSYLPITIEFGLKSLEGIFTQFIFKQIFGDINKRAREKLIPTLLIVEMKKILQNLKENGSLEDMIHYTVDWIFHDEVNRSKMLLELLKNIPLQKLDISFLLEVVSQNELIRKHIECLNLLLNAVIEISNSHNESQRDSLYAIGGDRKTMSSVSEYSSTTREWTATTPMPTPRTSFGCAVIGHKIYVCGGFDMSQVRRVMVELTVFDTFTRTWTQLPPMKHVRQDCAAAALNGQIYVAGGTNGYDRLVVVERYCVQTQRWQDVAPMTTKRADHELVELNGFLYAIGGEDRDSLNNVERYDPQTDQWTLMNNTKYLFSAFDSAVLNDNIYIAGNNKCEVYNATVKWWIEMPAPRKYGFGRRLAVFNGKLCAIGGQVEEKEEGIRNKTVEVYDFETHLWKPEPDMYMDVTRHFHGVAVVKN